MHNCSHSIVGREGYLPRFPGEWFSNIANELEPAGEPIYILVTDKRDTKGDSTDIHKYKGLFDKEDMSLS